MSVWRYLMKLYQPQAGWLLLGFVSLTVTWLSAAALLAVSGWFITACAMAGLGLIVNLNIFTPSAAIRALAILRTAGRYTERVIGHEAILRVLAHLRVRSFSAVASRPAREVDNRRYADLVNRLTADVDTLDGVPLRVIGPLFAALLTWATVVTVGAVWGSAAIALVIAVGGMSTFILAIWLARAGHLYGQAVIKARADQRVAFTDHFGGMAELMAYEQTASSKRRLAALDQAQTSRLNRQEQYGSVSEHGVQALTATSTLFVLALAWPTLDAPIVTLLALMTLGMNEALGTLPGSFWRVGESQEAGRRLMDLEANAMRASATSTAPDTSKPSTDKSQPTETIIKIVNLSCQRQPNTNLSLSAQLTCGRPLVVHGRSGTGKTSLLSTMAGELDPVSGQLMFNGVDLLSFEDQERYRVIGFLSQNDQLLDVTIREFLSLGLGTVDDLRLLKALEAVDLADTLNNTHEGLDYRLGVGGSRISGGQARRLQLAALLLRNPALVLLDEPFRGLQRNLVKTVIERITPWLSNRCCVIVTHDPVSLPDHWPRVAWPLEPTDSH